jgi:hypothetical protein
VRPLSAKLQALAVDHLDRLASKHRIKLRLSAKVTAETAKAWPSHRVAVAPYPRTAVDYLLALHELGHIIDRRALSHCASAEAAAKGSAAVYYNEILGEAAAWAWARKHAKPELLAKMSKKDWLRIADCWASYVEPAA